MNLNANLKKTNLEASLLFGFLQYGHFACSSIRTHGLGGDRCRLSYVSLLIFSACDSNRFLLASPLREFDASHSNALALICDKLPSCAAGAATRPAGCGVLRSNGIRRINSADPMRSIQAHPTLGNQILVSMFFLN